MKISAQLDEAMDLLRTFVRAYVRNHPGVKRQWRHHMCSARPYPVTHEWLKRADGVEICGYCGAFIDPEGEQDCLGEP